MPLPKPEKSENAGKNDPPVEVIADENKTPQPAPVVEIDPTSGQPVVEPRSAEPSVSAEEFRKMQARYEYQARQFERSQRELQEQIAQLNQVRQPVIHTEKTEGDEDVFGLNKDELNQIGQQDWTKPVRMMIEKGAEKKAREIVKEILAEQEKQRTEQIRQQTTTQILEREKQWVLEQEPSLNDETSDQFRGFYATYNRLVQEDPTLLTNPRAPRLVYREWKAEANSSGRQEAVDPEKERLKRVVAGDSPQGRSATTQKPFRLTQPDVDMCREKGISPAMYAEMKEANFKEGVTA